MTIRNRKRVPSDFKCNKLLFVCIILLSFTAGYFLSIVIPPRYHKKITPYIQKRVRPLLKRFEKRVIGRIAIIIDDNGYNADSCRYIRSISQPVTIAILPHLPFSRAVAGCAHARQKEIMLHIPLEPYNSKEKYPPGYVITTDMSLNTIRKILNDAIQSVPYARGVNNHMGSKATEDQRTMTILLDQLSRKGLFFVDSRVTLHSVAPRLAKKLNVLCAERNVFLDNQNIRSAIEQQFTKLAQEARQKGFAIGIGHARPLTWIIVQEQVIRLEREGFQIVTVKDILLSKTER